MCRNIYISDGYNPALTAQCVIDNTVTKHATLGKSPEMLTLENIDTVIFAMWKEVG